ncbi:hypothetical protein QMM61_09315 [Leptospira santarosai]|uniref:hypothetical protein n=1 Tax=Leptospira santarosai TaxID=28183 RepID=UPI0024AFBDFF|nr:hypothetical protein [Leptospira santarosai]MDI7196898.1 hypothetical protein [Leptospira santarosai]
MSVGAINIGKDGSFQVGILNFCKKGPIPIMIIVNYCSEPESKNLPPAPETEQKIETKSEALGL